MLFDIWRCFKEIQRRRAGNKDNGGGVYDSGFI